MVVDVCVCDMFLASGFLLSSFIQRQGQDRHFETPCALFVCLRRIFMHMHRHAWRGKIFILLWNRQTEQATGH